MSDGQESLASAQALAAVPMFAGLDPVDLAKLAGVLEERWFDAGSVVFEAGGEGDGLYIMREGVAERRVAGSAIDRIEPYASFGELSLLDASPRSATVAAHGEVLCASINHSDFEFLSREHPGILIGLLRNLALALAARLRRANQEISTAQSA